MKKLFILCLILFSCAGLQAQESLDIHVSEIEGMEALHCGVSSIYLHFHIVKTERATVFAQVWISNGLVTRYCYLDNGKVVGFSLDIESYLATGEKVYEVDVLTDESIVYVKGVFDKVERGDENVFEVPEQKGV